jgi:hypothetical protein
MHQQDTGLTKTEADRRKGLLGQLQDALADPRFYVFAVGGVDLVTTDGEVYWLAGDQRRYPCRSATVMRHRCINEAP